VPGVRDWLDRFRPAGAPGAATAAGVPVDRRAAALAELEPVFAALAADIARAAARRDELVAAATRRRAEGREAAGGIVAQARASAEAERAAEAARLRSLATEQTQARRGQAAAQVRDVRDRAAQRQAALVDAVVARVLAEIEELDRLTGRGRTP
jgi:hypothetical protein